jgi:hypothetical protein
MVPPTIAPTSTEFELEVLELELLGDDETLGVTLEESGPDQQQR